MERHASNKPLHGVRKLDLAAGAFFLLIEFAEDLRRKDIAADNAQPRRRLLGLRLFHHAFDFGDVASGSTWHHHAITMNFFQRLLFGRNDRAAADFVVGLHHLFQRAGFADQKIVRQQHREGLVANEVTRAPHSMAKTERLLLTREADRAGFGQALQKRIQFLGLLAFLEQRFEFVCVIEMIFDDVLAASCHEDELFDPRLACFLDGVLHNRLIHDRQHLFGDGLGRGKKTGAHAGDRQDGFSNRKRFCHVERLLQKYQLFLRITLSSGPCWEDYIWRMRCSCRV